MTGARALWSSRASSFVTMRKRLPELAVALVAFAAYVRAISAEAFWDDEFLTTRNPYLSWRGLRFLLTSDLWTASAKGEAAGYWRPLASLSYALNRLVGGNTTASYHAGNVLVHTAVAAAFVALARRLRVPTTIALAFGLLFATAPLGSEAVTWISGRFDLLGALLAVVACSFHASNRPLKTALAVLGAVACKESYVVVPVILVLYDALLRPRMALKRRWEFAGRYGMLALAVVVYVVGWKIVGTGSGAGAVAGLGMRVLLEGFAYVLYTLARGFFSPSELSPFHAYVRPTGLAFATTLGVVAAVSLAFGWAIRARPRSRWLRLSLFGWCWCIVGIAPCAVVPAIRFVIGDRYAYFPMLGLALGLAAGAAGLTRALKWEPLPRLLAAVGFVCLAFQCAGLWVRLSDWQTEERLLEVTVERDPDNFYALDELGEFRARHGRFPEAESLLLRARAAAPPGAAHFSSPIDTALCFVYLNEQHYPEGEAMCRARLAVAPADPRAWLNLASIELHEDRWQEALDDAGSALACKPRYAEAHYVRALALSRLGRTDEARTEAHAALSDDPGHARARALAAKLE
jgi:protein O-mannosyl-transferase